MKHSISLIQDPKKIGRIGPYPISEVVLRKGSGIFTIPHMQESYGGTNLWKFYLYCRNQGIHVTTIGSMCQLPLLSTISDRVILLSDTNILDDYDQPIHSQYKMPYRAMYDWGKKNIGPYWSVHNRHPLKLSEEETYNHWSYENLHCLKKSLEIPDSDVIEQFTWLKCTIRESAMRPLILEESPSDVIWCEFKCDACSDTCAKIISKRIDLWGHDRQPQKSLIEKYNEDYMGIQILSSQINNCSFIGWMGSANLFALLPLKPFALMDIWNIGSQRHILQEIHRRRYNEELMINPEEKYMIRPDLRREIQEYLKDTIHSNTAFGTSGNKFFQWAAYLIERLETQTIVRHENQHDSSTTRSDCIPLAT